jgi:hypothetical protein
MAAAGLADGRMRMDFKERVPFGRTGLMVSRMALASGYGVPTVAIEKAFHEYGVNYFYLSFLTRGNMVRAIHNLAPKHRDELCIVLAWPTFPGLFPHSFVTRWLRKLKIEQVDLMILQYLRRPDRVGWGPCGPRPPTPPYVRFRIRRFTQRT